MFLAVSCRSTAYIGHRMCLLCPGITHFCYISYACRTSIALATERYKEKKLPGRQLPSCRSCCNPTRSLRAARTGPCRRCPAGLGARAAAGVHLLVCGRPCALGRREEQGLPVPLRSSGKGSRGGPPTLKRSWQKLAVLHAECAVPRVWGRRSTWLSNPPTNALARLSKARSCQGLQGCPEAS